MTTISGQMDLVEEFWRWITKNGCIIADKRSPKDTPPGQPPSLNRFQSFLEALKRKDRAPAGSQNVRAIVKGDAEILLYVLSSNTERGVWSVSKNIIDCLREPVLQTDLPVQKIPWALILLHGHENCGYWFDSAQAIELCGRIWIEKGYTYLVSGSNGVSDGIKFFTEKKLLGLVESLTHSFS